MRRPAIALLLAAACGSSQSSGTLANKSGGGASNAANDALAFLPVDADFVMSFDVKQMTASGLWREYRSRIEDSVRDAMRQANAECRDFDFTKIERVAMAMQVGDGSAMKMVVVMRTPNANEVLECMAHDTKANATRDHDVVLIHKDSIATAAKVVGNNTLVVQGGTTADAASLAAVISAGAPLRNSPAFLKIYDKLPHDATMWGVLNGNSSTMQRLGGMMGIHPRAAFGTLMVGDGIAANGHISFASADEAQNLATMLQAQAGMAKAMFTKLDIAASGDEVVIDAAITAQQIRTLLQSAGFAGRPPPPVPTTP